MITSIVKPSVRLKNVLFYRFFHFNFSDKFQHLQNIWYEYSARRRIRQKRLNVHYDRAVWILARFLFSFQARRLSGTEARVPVTRGKRHDGSHRKTQHS